MLFSCAKNDDNTEQNQQYIVEDIQQISESKSFNRKGIQHNRDLKYLLDHLPTNTNIQNIRIYTEQILKEKYQQDNLGDLYIFKDYSNPNRMLDELFEKKWISKDLYDLAKNDFRDLNNFENYDYSIDNFINSRIKNAQILEVEDTENYYNFLSVLKHSFHFWNPNSKNNNATNWNLRSKHIDIDAIIQDIIEIAEADSVTNLISTGGFEIPYTTFDYVQSSYFRFNRF